jgi:hypothetical protein
MIIGLGELKVKVIKRLIHLGQPRGLWGLVFVLEQTWTSCHCRLYLIHGRWQLSGPLNERYDYPSIARITAMNLQSPKYFQNRATFLLMRGEKWIRIKISEGNARQSKHGKEFYTM